MPESDILMFEGFNMDAALTRKFNRKFAPNQADQLPKPLHVKWIEHGNIPLKPTKTRIDDFIKTVKVKATQAGANRTDVIKNQIKIIGGLEKNNKNRAKYHRRMIVEGESKLNQLANRRGTPEYTDALNETMAHAALFIRESLRACKLAMAKSILNNMRAGDDMGNAWVVAVANMVRELPVKIKVPKVYPLNELFANEKFALATIQKRGRINRTMRAGQFQVRHRTPYVSSYPASMMSGFSSDLGFSFPKPKDIVGWAEDQVRGAAESLGKEITGYVDKKVDETVASAKTVVSRQFNKVIGGAMISASRTMNDLSKGAASSLSTTGKSMKNGTAIQESESFRVPSWLLPVGIFLGGSALVVYFIK